MSQDALILRQETGSLVRMMIPGDAEDMMTTTTTTVTIHSVGAFSVVAVLQTEYQVLFVR
jgi:hypothetical protein